MVLYLGMYITWLHAELWHKTKGEAVRCLARRTEWGGKLTARQIEALLRTVTLFKIGKGAGDREPAEQDSSYTWLPPRGKRRMQAEATTMRTSSINATIREMPRHEATRRQAEWMHLFANAKAHVSLFSNGVLKSAQGFYVFTPQFKFMAQIVFNNVSLDRTNTYAEEQALAAAMERVAGVRRVTASAAAFIGNEARGWTHGTTKPPGFPTCGREWFDAWEAWDDNTTLSELVARLVQAAREHTERHQRAFASTLCVDYDKAGSAHCLPFARDGAILHIVPTLDDRDAAETDWEEASSDDAPAQESLDVYDADVGRGRGDADLAGGDAKGRGDAVGRQNARVVVRDADPADGNADGGLDDGGVTRPGAGPVPRPSMRRQNARVLRDACVDAVTEDDQSAAKRTKARHGERSGGTSDVERRGLSLSNLKMSPMAYAGGAVLDGQEGPVARDCEQKQGDVCIKR